MTISTARPGFTLALATTAVCLTLATAAHGQVADPVISDSVPGTALALRPSTSTCDEFLARKFAHLDRDAATLRVTMATNQQAQRPPSFSVVSYGELWLDGPARPGLQCSGSACEWVRTAQGNGIQLFNDRRPRFDQPFDATRADRLSVRLDSKGRMVLTLDSWPFGRKPNERHITLQCQNEVMFGFDEIGVMYTITLTEDTIPG